MRREVRSLYNLLLKEKKKVSSLDIVISFYEDYKALCERAQTTHGLPESLKNLMYPIKMPKYLAWAKRYMKKTRKKRR